MSCDCSEQRLAARTQLLAQLSALLKGASQEIESVVQCERRDDHLIRLLEAHQDAFSAILRWTEGAVLETQDELFAVRGSGAPRDRSEEAMHGGQG